MPKEPRSAAKDYRYSLNNAMTSVKSSYFKYNSELSKVLASSSIPLKFFSEELCFAEASVNEVFKRIKEKIDKAVQVSCAKNFFTVFH